MTTTGKINEKYEVLSTPSFTKQRFKFTSDQGEVMFFTCFGEEKVKLLSSFAIDLDVKIEYGSDRKEKNGKVYVNLYANTITLKSKEQSFKEIYDSSDENTKKIVDKTLHDLELKHLCKLDKYQYFSQVMGMINKFGVKTIDSNFKELMTDKPIKINHDNLENVMLRKLV